MKTPSEKERALYYLRKNHIIDCNNKECYDYYGERLYSNGQPMFIEDKIIPYNAYYNAEYNIAKRKHCNWHNYYRGGTIET